MLRAGEHADPRPPAVVKPVDADNSLGVSLVRERDAYDAALGVAFGHSRPRAGGGVRPARPRGALRHRWSATASSCACRSRSTPSTRVRAATPTSSPRRRRGRLRLVAKEPTKAWIVDPGDPVTDAVWDAARRCHAALGCRHYSLFDFRVDPDGRPWFIEAGLYCSFSDRSVVATMAAAAGIGIDDLYRTALQEAMTT